MQSITYWSGAGKMESKLERLEKWATAQGKSLASWIDDELSLLGVSVPADANEKAKDAIPIA